MLLSLVISLKRRADIQLDMSTSQAEKPTCESEEERMIENSRCCEDERNCGICDRAETSTGSEGEA